jgi:hypothetical protein
MKSKPVRVTRRALTGLLAGAPALLDRTQLQAQEGSPDALASARNQFRDAANALDSVKIPMTVEPAVRFEP